MQRSLFKVSPLYHGGEYATDKAKTKRPLSTKHSHHVVLRAGEEVNSFLRKERRDFITLQIRRWAKYFKVRIYAQSINSNHIHLIAYSTDRTLLQYFLRVLPGQIAQKLGKNINQFWKHLIFTRIVVWGKAFKNILNYVEKNTLEAAGIITYSPRNTRKPNTS